MRSLHFPVPSPACLIAAVLLEFPTLLFSGHAAEPVAAPVPDHERTGTATPQEPGRIAALKRACEKHGVLFGIYYLQRIGAWVNPNRAAFEGASQSPFAKTPDWGFVTCREGKVYLIIRSSAASAPVTLPSLNNRLLGARLLSKPETRIDASAGGHEWQVGPVPGHPDGPFVVVELSVEGHPVVAGR